MFGDNAYSITNHLQELELSNINQRISINAHVLGSLRILSLSHVNLHTFAVSAATPLESLDMVYVHAIHVDISACMSTLQSLTLVTVKTDSMYIVAPQSRISSSSAYTAISRISSLSKQTARPRVFMPLITKLTIYEQFEKPWITPLMYAAIQSHGLLRLDIRAPVPYDVDLPTRMPESTHFIASYGSWDNDTFADYNSDANVIGSMKLTNRIIDMSSGNTRLLGISLVVGDFAHLDTICNRFDVEFVNLWHIQFDIRRLSAKFSDFITVFKEQEQKQPSKDAVRIMTIEDALDGSPVAIFINPLNKAPIHTPVHQVNYKIHMYWSETVVREPMQKLVATCGSQMRLWFKSSPSLFDWMYDDASWCCPYSRCDIIPCWCQQIINNSTSFIDKKYNAYRSGT